MGLLLNARRRSRDFQAQAGFRVTIPVLLSDPVGHEARVCESALRADAPDQALLTAEQHCYKAVRGNNASQYDSIENRLCNTLVSMLFFAHQLIMLQRKKKCGLLCIAKRLPLPLITPFCDGATT